MSKIVFNNHLSWLEIVFKTMLKTFSLRLENGYNQTIPDKMCRISHPFAVPKAVGSKLKFNEDSVDTCWRLVIFQNINLLKCSAI